MSDNKGAAISAAAGILGALVGGTFTYFAAQAQIDAQSQQFALTDMRATYANYMTDVVNLRSEQFTFYSRLKQGIYETDSVSANAQLDKINAAETKYRQSESVLRLVDEGKETDSIRQKISDKQVDISNFITVTAAMSNMNIRDNNLSGLGIYLNEINDLVSEFANQAKNELR